MSSVADIPQFLRVAGALNLTIGFVGAHGRGKTATVNQFGDAYGYEDVIVCNASQWAPEDMLGLPMRVKNDKGEDVTTFSCPKWLVEACNKKVILFFDEFTNAELDVQASILKLIDEREHEGHKLHPETLIVMAYNPESIAPNGHSLSMATRDRICVIPITDEDSKSAYKDYWSKNGKPMLSDIATDILDIVKDHSEEVREAAYENAEFTYRSLEHAYNICMYCHDNHISNNIAKDMCSGYGGVASGQAFVSSFMDKVHVVDAMREIHEACEAKDLEQIIDSIVSYDTLVDDGSSALFNKRMSLFKNIEQALSDDKDLFMKVLERSSTKEFVVAYCTNNH